MKRLFGESCVNTTQMRRQLADELRKDVSEVDITRIGTCAYNKSALWWLSATVGLLAGLPPELTFMLLASMLVTLSAWAALDMCLRHRGSSSDLSFDGMGDGLTFAQYRGSLWGVGLLSSAVLATCIGIARRSYGTAPASGSQAAVQPHTKPCGRLQLIGYVSVSVLWVLGSGTLYLLSFGMNAPEPVRAKLNVSWFYVNQSTPDMVEDATSGGTSWAVPLTILWIAVGIPAAVHIERARASVMAEDKSTEVTDTTHLQLWNFFAASLQLHPGRRPMDLTLTEASGPEPEPEPGSAADNEPDLWAEVLSSAIRGDDDGSFDAQDGSFTLLHPSCSTARPDPDDAWRPL